MRLEWKVLAAALAFASPVAAANPEAAPRGAEFRPFAAHLARATRRSSGSRMPPSWDLPKAPDVELDEEEDAAPRQRPRYERPWYKPRAALGVGFNIPEFIPFEGILSFGRFFAIRAYFAPMMPFNIRVEMPADVISAHENTQIGIANPDFTIRLKANYGPQYGIDAIAFPFGGSFFVSGGLGYRNMRLTGDAKSQILICSFAEAAKEPPCGDPNASLRPDTALEIQLDARTEAILARSAIGGMWNVGSAGYFSLTLGATKPFNVRRNVAANANILSPSGNNDDISGSLAQVKEEQEADLKSKAIKQMRPVDEQPLPLFGLSAGIRF